MRTQKIGALGLAVAAGFPAIAQTSDSRSAVRVTVGYSKQYLDEPWRPSVGGSVRLRLFSRFNVEPEFVSSRGPRFQQWTIIPNVLYDLSDPARRFTTYVIGGGGYFRELDKSIHHRRQEMARCGGLGVKVRLRDGLFLSPAFRVGHITRAAVGIGYQF